MHKVLYKLVRLKNFTSVSKEWLPVNLSRSTLNRHSRWVKTAREFVLFDISWQQVNWRYYKYRLKKPWHICTLRKIMHFKKSKFFSWNFQFKINILNSKICFNVSASLGILSSKKSDSKTLCDNYFSADISLGLFWLGPLKIDCYNCRKN